MKSVDGWEVGVEVGGSINDYAMALLHIFNNVKSSRELVRVRKRLQRWNLCRMPR